MVSCINYKRVDGGVISPSEIGTLLQVNAPKADWSADSEKDSTGLVWWDGQVSRDPFARPFVVSRMQSLVPNGSLITARRRIFIAKIKVSVAKAEHATS
jgi:hypothetical protein